MTKQAKPAPRRFKQSGVEWCDVMWNITTGCTDVSAGCVHCYAKADSHRMGLHPNPKIRSRFEGLTVVGESGQPKWTGIVRTHPHLLGEPHGWKRPLSIFVCGESDLFHEAVPLAFIEQALEVMWATPRHRYYLVTKRAERASVLSRQLQLPPNAWLIFSCEDQKALLERAPWLVLARAEVRGISAEPLLGPLDLAAVPGLLPTEVELIDMNPNLRERRQRRFRGRTDSPVTQDILAQYERQSYLPIRTIPHGGALDWVIVGGESHRNRSLARRMPLTAATGLVRQCREHGVAVYTKQLGSDFAEREGLAHRRGGKPEQWGSALRNQLPRQWPARGLDWEEANRGS